MPYVYQASACLAFRQREGLITCRDQRCEACHGGRAARFHCAAGQGGPFACELERGHVGSHCSAFKWDSDGPLPPAEGHSCQHGTTCLPEE